MKSFAFRTQFFEAFCKMSRHDELPVYKATYDMMLSVFSFACHVTKEHKHSVGDTLRKGGMDLR